METLHIYAQGMWHEEAYIMGTPYALGCLRAAIDAAIAIGKGNAELFVNDGEGYTVHVLAASDSVMQEMAVPYTDKMAAAEPNESGPWKLL